MRKALLGLVVLASLLVVTGVSAQTATFTWNGDATNGVPLATIDGQQPNASIGYAGSIQLTNGYMMWLLDLPEGLTDPPGAYNFPSFPNNGFLDCETLLTFGAKQWVVGDGTHAGDSYYLPASTSCPLWNGTTVISITEFHQFIQHRTCYRGRCSTFLVDTELSGTGTAVVQ